MQFMPVDKFISEVARFVKKYAPLYNIKVYSPVIAQAVLESARGTSNKVYHNGDWRHNYFGLKWRENRCPIALGWFTETGSEQDQNTQDYITSEMKWCRFRNLEECVHGYFQWTNIPHYKSLKGVTDPRTYLERIKACGYATSINYVENVMNVIKKYDLTRFDDINNTDEEQEENKTMSKVFLSAGHGGSDPGACAFGMKEKDINLKVMLACKDVLEQHGISVVCSRLKDENDAVSQEVVEANASNAVLCVSFHVNAGKGDGFEAFCNLNNKNGVKLAKLAEKNIKELGQNSRGIKNGMNLYFIRKTSATSVLFESFFIDNDTDNNIGDTLKKQEALGVAYAKAILEFLEVSYDGETEQEEQNPNTQTFCFRIKVDELNIRTGAGAEYTKCGVISDKLIYTILETKRAKDGGVWGRLKSGAGWVNVSNKFIEIV